MSIKNAKIILSAFKQVFSSIRYLTIAGVTALSAFALFVWLPNFKLIAIVVTSSVASLSDKFSILAGLLTSIQTNFTIFSASYTITIAVLFGINTAMVVYFISRRKKLIQQSGIMASMGGLFSGILGIGCASCGTFVLGPLLSLIGIGGLIVFLPLGGQEFGVISVIILGFSVFFISKKIQNQLTCLVK